MNISLDFWNTLAKGNPRYKLQRDKYVQDFIWNRCQKAIERETISEVFNERKKTDDAEMESTGIQIPYQIIYHNILKDLVPDFRSSIEDVNDLKDLVNESFNENFPFIYCDKTIEKLKEWKSDGHTLYITSNTNLITGENIRLALADFGILDLFAATYFSDEMKICKPNYRMLINDIDIHIGDNETTDNIPPTKCIITKEGISNINL